MLSGYRFERTQYMEFREAWAGKGTELAGKSAGDTYGAEHLCRLLGTLDTREVWFPTNEI